MKRRKGFTLMEIVVAMLIAVMISASAATILAISFRTVSDNEAFRHDKIFVDRAFEFIKDEIAIASKVEIVDKKEVKLDTAKYKKGITVNTNGRIRVTKNSVYIDMYPLGLYQLAENKFNLAVTIDEKKKSVLKVELDYIGANGKIYSKKASVRVNLLGKTGGEITGVKSGKSPDLTILLG